MFVMRKLLISFIDIFFTVLGVSVGNYLVKIYPEYWQELLGNWVGATPFLVMSFLFGAGFYLSAHIAVKILLEWYENWITTIEYEKIWHGFLGGILGLILGNLFFVLPYYFFISQSLQELGKEASDIAMVIKVFSPIIINFTFFFIGVTLLSKLTNLNNQDDTSNISESILLDSNIIIDGRIGGVIKSGFLMRKIIIPDFIVSELQVLADSSNQVKRKKGRLGLKNLEDLKDEFKDLVSIVDSNISGETIDDKLINFAISEGCIIFTNDYNLTKISRVKLTPCINLNELSNSLKLLLAPGDDIVVELVKSGRENHQAVGYMDDGTMIVVEHAHKYIGRLLEVTVSNIINTQAGKIIFAKLKKIKREGKPYV